MEQLTKKTIGQQINAALASKDVKQKELAKHLGVPDNTISYFVSGKRVPNTEQIIKIAQFLNVSTDFLLGLTDVQGTDTEIKAICEYTGLSEKSIEKLHSQRETHQLFINANADSFVYERYEQLIDYLISPVPYSFEADLLTSIVFYKRDLKKLTNKLKRYKKETEVAFDNYKLFGFEDTRDELLFRKFKMTNHFNAFIDQYTSKELAECIEAEKQYYETHAKLLEEEEARRKLYANNNQTE